MQEVTLTLPMVPNMELTASKTACAMSEHIRMSPDKIDEVQMAVVEACLNAFEHSRAKSREVLIRFEVLGTEDDPLGIQITISDNGVGFSPDNAGRRGEQKLHVPRKRGHGLMIINGLMDEVDIQSSSQGTTVIMRKMR
jgi:serine/threonine-protein kinase RsbW